MIVEAHCSFLSHISTCTVKQVLGDIESSLLFRRKVRIRRKKYYIS